jgi:hypothetical protein
MQVHFLQPQINQSKSTNASWLTRWVAVALATGAFSPALVLAQSGKLGSYTGTFQVSGTEVSPQVTFRATVKVSLPVTERDSSSITADFITEDAPNASVQIAQWDSSLTEKSVGSDGKFSHWTCTLAAPVEIAMKPTGILNVDLAKKTHELSMTLLSTQEVSFNCVHSQSGAYKKKQGISLYIGTGAPGAQGKAPMPFTDAARLTAKYTLMPTAKTRDRYGPIVQEWDLRLAR